MFLQIINQKNIFNIFIFLFADLRCTYKLTTEINKFYWRIFIMSPEKNNNQVKDERLFIDEQNYLRSKSLSFARKKKKDEDEDFDDDEESDKDDYYNEKDEEEDDLFGDEPDEEDDLFKDDFAIDEEDEDPFEDDDDSSF